MAAQFDRLGVRFLYPENWVISEEQADSNPRIVSLESPEGALWTLSLHPDRGDPSVLTKKVLETLQAEEEYVDFDIEPVRQRLADFEAEGYDLQFFCRHQVVSARIRGLNCGDFTLLILCQSEDREFERLEPVFRAITHSLLTSANWENSVGQ